MKNKHKSKKPRSLQEKIFDVLIYGMAILLILLIIYPLWFVIIASFSNPQDVATGAVWFWPKSWSLEGYKTLFAQPLIWRSYFNTILYTVAGTAFGLLVNIPVGYALSRRDLFGRKWISLLYVVPMFVTGGLIPIYLVTKNFGLLNTVWVMIVPFAVSPYNIIVARTFFQESIPNGLWEAAQVDGSSTFRYFSKLFFLCQKRFLQLSVFGQQSEFGTHGSML